MDEILFQTSSAETLTVETLILERILPTVLGVTIGCFGLLFLFGAICNRREERQRIGVAPASDTQPQQSRATPEHRYGPVACEAHLWGMSDKERRSVLERVFEGSVTTYDRDDHETNSIEATKKQGEEKITDNSHHGDAIANMMEQGWACVSEHAEDVDTRCCAICLRDYENGDQVMTGTTCDHMFHYDCAMEWLANPKRPNDHCPYCRNPMMTPTAMKTAALATLGASRIQEMAAQVPGNNNNAAADGTGNSTQEQ